jgi:hypothetical protein
MSRHKILMAGKVFYRFDIATHTDTGVCGLLGLEGRMDQISMRNACDAQLLRETSYARRAISSNRAVKWRSSGASYVMTNPPMESRRLYSWTMDSATYVICMFV